MKRTQKTITFTKKPLNITNDLIMDAVNIIKVGGSANGAAPIFFNALEV